MSEDSVETQSVHPDWEAVRSRLRRSHPGFYELEAGGALLMALEDVMSLMSEGTPEDLGTDEVAKQAKYYLQPAVAKFRPALRGAGFEETTEMTEDYVAATFHKAVDYHKPEGVEQMVT